MSFFTKIRDSVTGIGSTALGLAGGVSGILTGGLTSPLGGAAAIGGLAGLLGGGQGEALPQMGQSSQTPQNQDFGPQTNLENLLQQTGLQQPQISQTSRVGGGGLI